MRQHRCSCLNVLHQQNVQAYPPCRVLRGAFRIHGGGFGGTVQAFVPDDLLDAFRARLESVFGPGSCHVMQIRPVGFTRLK